MDAVNVSWKVHRAWMLYRIHRPSVAALIFATNLLALASLTLWCLPARSFAEDHSLAAKDLLAQGESSPGQAVTSEGGSGGGGGEKAESRRDPSGSVDMPTPGQGESGDIESRGLGGPIIPLITIPTLLPLPTQLNGAIACSKDQGDPQGTAGRDLSGFMFTDAAMTNGKCRIGCASRGFAFAGTQVGTYCFCGNSFGKSGLATCTSSCAGNRAEICGGVWANSVSVTGVVPPTPPVPSNGGRCVTSIQASRPDPGNTSKMDTYRYTEIQLWVVAGMPMQRVYPVQWTATGSGELHTDDGLNTVNASWGISGAQLIHFQDQINMSTNIRRVSQQELFLTTKAQITGTQQKTTGSMVGPVGNLTAEVSELGFDFQRPAGVMSPITATSQQMNVVGKLMQPNSWATGTTSCDWNLAVLP